jgi:adenosylcobinamide kinase / adenosylcobinamide-phosphate guanylyltransferase
VTSRHEFILGGQRSGKSRCAEQRAADWLAQPGRSAERSAVLLATALGGDDEMRLRIPLPPHDRALRVPGLLAHEVPRALAAAVRSYSAPGTLVVVDCLTLWLTNLLMPLSGSALTELALTQEIEALCAALREASGPVVCVSNEIGMGLSPLSPEARRFVDELGRLHQAVAALSGRVTLMVAGLPLTVKPVAQS